MQLHCKNLNFKERNKLAAAAVMPQAAYKVNHCKSYASADDYVNGIPMEGVWVLPSILGRRDLVLVW